MSLTRREVLAGAAAAGAAALTRNIATVAASAARSNTPGNPSPPTTPLTFSVPPGTCDCHTHIVGDPLRFPFAGSRAFTPEPASVADLRALHGALRVDRVVIVQPSFYGTDNSCTLDAIKEIGPSARGIAAIGDSTTNEELDRLHRGGMRGIRVSMIAKGPDAAFLRQQFKAATGRIAGRNWHVELMTTELWQIEALKDEITASPVPVSIDLGSQSALGIHQPGFDTFLGLIHGCRIYVNVSGSYGIAKSEPEYPDVAPTVKALIAANPQRITWGTNWPHAGRGLTGTAEVDDGREFNRFAALTSGADQLKVILVDNPARLYDF